MSSCSLEKVIKLEIAEKASAMGAGLLGQASTQGGGEGNESLMQGLSDEDKEAELLGLPSPKKRRKSDGRKAAAPLSGAERLAKEVTELEGDF